MKSLTTPLVVLLCLVGLRAEAQELTVRERVYVQGLAKQLDLRVTESVGVTDEDGGKGLRVTFSDGTTLTRLRYPDANGALTKGGVYQGDGATTDPPIAVQVRDRQVVLVQGAAMSDPLAARAFLESGWSYLRGGDAPVSMTGYLEGNDVIGLTGPEGPFYSGIGDAVTTAERVGDSGTANQGVTFLPDDLFRWDADSSSLVSIFERGPQGGSAVVASDPERARELIERLETIAGEELPIAAGLPTPTPVAPALPKPTPAAPTLPEAPVEGAAKKLDSLFD